MGLIQKKDESKDEIEGIEIIERGQGPDGIEENPVELVSGESAEDLAAGTTAAERAAEEEAQMFADADDDALKEEDLEELDDEDDEDDDEKPAGNKKTMCIVAAVAAVVIAAIVGYFVGHGGFGSKGINSATITESQLDTAVATYTYNGKSYDITAREALESTYSLENLKNDDDTYNAPSADTVLSYARTQILLQVAESEGIAPTDDEVTAYAEEQLGTSDYSEMATQYGVTEDQAKEIAKQQATVQALYDSVVDGDVDDLTYPEAPTEPEDGNEETASQEYATYIINLAGDEWDSETGTWASEDGTYATALAGEEFTAESATYAQALKAYNQAITDYFTAASGYSNAWTEYSNGLYASANIQIYGLLA